MLMLSAVAVERGLDSCISEADTNADSEEPCDSSGAPTIGQRCSYYRSARAPSYSRDLPSR